MKFTVMSESEHEIGKLLSIAYSGVILETSGYYGCA